MRQVIGKNHRGVIFEGLDMVYLPGNEVNRSKTFYDDVLLIETVPASPDTPTDLNPDSSAPVVQYSNSNLAILAMDVTPGGEIVAVAADRTNPYMYLFKGTLGNDLSLVSSARFDDGFSTLFPTYGLTNSNQLIEAGIKSARVLGNHLYVILELGGLFYSPSNFSAKQPVFKIPLDGSDWELLWYGRSMVASELLFPVYLLPGSRPRVILASGEIVEFDEANRTVKSIFHPVLSGIAPVGIFSPHMLADGSLAFISLESPGQVRVLILGSDYSVKRDETLTLPSSVSTVDTQIAAWFSPLGGDLVLVATAPNAIVFEHYKLGNGGATQFASIDASSFSDVPTKNSAGEFIPWPLIFSTNLMTPLSDLYVAAWVEGLGCLYKVDFDNSAFVRDTRFDECPAPSDGGGGIGVM